MGRKIIVAGAGHGGLAVAAILASKGYDVTVYERDAEGTLGYDWTDIFAPGALAIAGIPMPDEDKFEYKENMTFYSPDMKKGLRQNVSKDQLEIKMERKDIYEHLINHAVGCGVKIIYNCNIDKPVLLGNRIIGIRTSLGSFYADLIIDAAGVDSPIRTKLPKACGVENEVRRYEQLYVYRAFFDKVCDEEPKDKFKVCLLPKGEIGINWVATEKKYADLLIGRFSPLNIDDVNAQADSFREINPVLGKKILRGGQFVKIPVRQPLSVMVCDGYAAIGDSAFMTVPIIGSGIANSLKAARMLADTIIEDKEGAYCAETLWNYQRRYYKQLGAGLAVLACVKLLLVNLKPAELDYIFEKNILTAKEFSIGADSTSLTSMINASPAELLQKAQALCKDTELLKKISGVGIRIGKVTAATAIMPRKWSREQVFAWSKKYLEAFEK